MLDRYGRQVFSEFYFPWLEEWDEPDSIFAEAPSTMCRVLSFQAAPAASPQAASVTNGSEFSGGAQ